MRPRPEVAERRIQRDRSPGDRVLAHKRPAEGRIARAALVVRGVEDEREPLIAQALERHERKLTRDTAASVIRMGHRVDRAHGAYHGAVGSLELPRHEMTKGHQTV